MGKSILLGTEPLSGWL